jgi:membrane-associated phospholipid phosphatase
LQLHIKIIEIMSPEKFLLTLMLFSSFHANSFGHSFLGTDSIPGKIDKQWITPSALFATGAAIAGIPALRKIERSVYNGFKPGRKLTSVDDYTQYVPAITVFAMDAAGLKGKNKPQQQFLLYALGNVTATVIVQPMKRIIGRERPNKSDFHSFPSGHTSTAFVAAEFLHQEYGHYSPWISIAGYATAATTGYLRMYNNEHWLGDVLAGAAIGMASTKFIYWMNGKMKEKKRNLVQAF